MPSDDDQLALTATAPSGRPSAKQVVRATLGRFKVERELGAGGMGVVHAAFDPELERRVALKVLRASSEDSKARLLREARAMAKLSHPNVITVFEVGSADGEDFVAMELIEGGTLGDWIDRTRPRPRELVAAFVAAGRGLAAAHAQGLVHRDFKPNNVLRSSGGRIVVTDFGLARSDDLEEPRGGRDETIALDQTQTPTAPALTRTGSLLGTPAYMAPEQWRTETVTGATDQFAFCVALWEALAGKRPYGGTTLDELKADVLRGPGELDAGQLPRRLRPVLRRGLAVDPTQRWPSMTALLDAIGRATSRRYLAIAAGAGLIAAGAAVYLATRSPVRAECVPPAIDPDAIALDAAAKPYVDGWRAHRDAVCDGTSELRTARLACLDGVVARIVDAFRDGNPGPDALGFELVDPAVCDRDTPPRLSLPIDDRLSKAFAGLRQAKASWRSIATGLTAPTLPACVRTVALLAEQIPNSMEYEPTTAAKQAGLSTALETAAQACDDEAIRAQAALHRADADDPAGVKVAEEAAKKFPSDTNLALLDDIHASVAARANRYDDAIAAFGRAISRNAAAGRKQLELEAAIRLTRLYIERSTAADLLAAVNLVATYRALAATHGRETELGGLSAKAMWRQGDVAGGDKLAREVKYHYGAAPFVDSQFTQIDIRGTVLDEHHQPVAGATVAAAGVLWGDDVEISSAVAHISSPVETTTGADGTFTLVGARGTVMASLGDRVSRPVRIAPSVTLELGPTSTIEGDVDLAKESPGRVRIVAMVVGDKSVQFHTGPLDARGHFKLARVPRTRVAFAAIGIDQVSGFDPTAAPRPITEPAVSGIRVAFDSMAGKLFMIGRSEVSTTPESAIGMVFRGAHPEAKGTLRQIFSMLGGPVGQIAFAPVDMANLPAPFKGHADADDLIGTLDTRPHGDLTICAVAMTRKALAGATSIDKLVHVIQDADAGCVVVADSTELATLPLPALKRLRD